jgi:hypothetical protein
MYIRPYRSLDERAALRPTAIEQVIWPPEDTPVLRQESKIVLAAPFSQIR